MDLDKVLQNIEYIVGDITFTFTCGTYVMGINLNVEYFSCFSLHC